MSGSVTENPEWEKLTDWKVEMLMNLGSVRKYLSKDLVRKTRRAIRLADVDGAYHGVTLGQSRSDKSRVFAKAEKKALKRLVKELSIK